jgi:hypothetical protein
LTLNFLKHSEPVGIAITALAEGFMPFLSKIHSNNLAVEKKLIG